MNARGFTLIELLVAVAVLALMSALAYGGLNGLIRQYEQSEAQVERLAALQRTMTLLGNDLLQVHARGVREPFHGDRVGALLGDPDAVADDGWSLLLTRGGWSNPARQRRATLQRVGWRLRDGRLERAHWRLLDRAADRPPVVTPLADGVDELEWRFLDDAGEWHEQWPPAEAGDAPVDQLPRALEMRVLLEDGAGIRRLYAL